MNKNQISWRRAWAFACLFFAAAWPFAAQAQNVVESVTSSIQAGVEVRCRSGRLLSASNANECE